MMKKKLFSLAVTLVMALSLAVPAMAADITVTDAVEGEDYTAYKIFDVTQTGNTADASYAYTIDSDSKWVSVVNDYSVDENDVFTLTPSATDAGKLVVAVNELNEASLFEDTEDARLFAEYLMEHIPEGLVENTDFWKETATADGVSFTGLPAGYYFLDTSLGSLCALYTTNSSQTLAEKNAEPNLVKNIVVGDQKVESTTATIGDDVNFEIVVTDGTGTDKDIVVHDTMEAGLTLDQSSIKINGVAVTEEQISYDATDDCTFEITLNAADYADNAQIVITYTAELNAQAEIAFETNDNTAWLTYSKQESTHDTVKVHSYQFGVIKTDGTGTELDGASFELYDSATAGNKIALVEESEGVYRVATETEASADNFTSAVIEAGQATIKGLGNGTYYLEETAAPQGYNLLTERKAVTIENANIDVTDMNADEKYVDGTDSGIIVINESGALLPSTGGMGTTIFYVVGGTLVVAAAVLLITKKRMHNVED